MTKPTIPEYKDRFRVYHEANPGASLARVLLQMSVTQRRKLAHMLWAAATNAD